MKGMVIYIIEKNRRTIERTFKNDLMQNGRIAKGSEQGRKPEWQLVAHTNNAMT